LVRMSAINEEANAVDEQQRDVTVETEDGRESTTSADDLRQEDNGRIQRRETVETESSNQKIPAQPLRVKEEMSMQHTGEQGGKSLSVSPSQLVESVEVQNPSATIKREHLVHHHPFITPSIKLEPRQRKWAGDLAEDPIEIDDDD
jgi:hypothetical protein